MSDAVPVLALGAGKTPIGAPDGDGTGAGEAAAVLAAAMLSVMAQASATAGTARRHVKASTISPQYPGIRRSRRPRVPLGREWLLRLPPRIVWDMFFLAFRRKDGGMTRLAAAGKVCADFPDLRICVVTVAGSRAADRGRRWRRGWERWRRA